MPPDDVKLPDTVTVGLLSVNIPPLADPIVIFVKELGAASVPILSALVVPPTVAPVAKLYVLAPVDVVNMFTVCAAVVTLPKLYVVTALNSETVVAAFAKFNVPVNPVLSNASVPLVMLVEIVPGFNVKVALVALPMVVAVEAPAMFTVNAFVLIKLNVPVVGVVMLVAISGLVRLGVEENTNAPEPVSSLIAFARVELVALAKKLATPPARPVMPVDTGTDTEISAVPSNGCPLMFLATVNRAADPVVF